jgi:hypothetical protein
MQHGKINGGEMPHKTREEIREKDKRYYQKNREIIIEKVAKYNKLNPEKRKCRDLVNSAIRYGKLKREPCFCGKEADAHHEDYSKPFDIVWLCKYHHRMAHGLVLYPK